MTIKNKIQIGVGIVVIFLFFLLMFFGDNAMLELNRLKKEKNQLIEINEGLVRQNDIMYKEIERLKHDPRYVENVARQDFGMIGKDEIIFKIDTHKSSGIHDKVK